MAEENEHNERPGASTSDQQQKPDARKNAQPAVAFNLIAMSVVHVDPWHQLTEFTQARLALGRAGSSLPTKAILNFDLSHALARDAVHLALDVIALEKKIENLGFTTLQVHSKTKDRTSYLLRPDWGRKLDEASRHRLQSMNAQDPIDFLIVVGDGLSSLAIERQAVPLLVEIQKHIPPEWRTGSVVIASHARVALADEIAELMNARSVAILIGERPGLTSPDSLGIYFTFSPRVGCNDADRNCISNIRPEGLDYASAAKKLIWLAKESMKLKVSGVALKDESDSQLIDVNSSR